MELYLFKWFTVRPLPPTVSVSLEQLLAGALEQCLSGSQISLIRFGAGEHALELVFAGQPEQIRDSIISLMANLRTLDPRSADPELSLSLLGSRFELLPLGEAADTLQYK